MIIRTEAVVLRKMDYGETSQIVTLLTREKGKLTVLAKGARLPKSRFGATLQPMAYTQVVFYYKPTRGLQTLRESAHVTSFHHIGRDLERIGLGLRMVELVHALLQEEEHNPMVFSLLLQVLHRLDAGEGLVANLLPYFQLRLAAVLGFAPHFEREAVAQLPAQGVLTLDDGAILPAAGGTTGSAVRRAGRTALRAFAICARAEVDVVLRLRLEPDVALALSRLVEDFLRHHVGDAYPSKSHEVLGQMAAPRSS